MLPNCVTYLSLLLKTSFTALIALPVTWDKDWHQCDQIWRKLKGLGQFYEGLFSIWQNCYLLRQILNAIGQFFMVVNGQIMKTVKAIWSHWLAHRYYWLNRCRERQKLKRWLCSGWSSSCATLRCSCLRPELRSRESSSRNVSPAAKWSARVTQSGPSSGCANCR